MRRCHQITSSSIPHQSLFLQYLQFPTKSFIVLDKALIITSRDRSLQNFDKTPINLNRRKQKATRHGVNAFNNKFREVIVYASWCFLIALEESSYLKYVDSISDVYCLHQIFEIFVGVNKQCRRVYFYSWIIVFIVLFCYRYVLWRATKSWWWVRIDNTEKSNSEWISSYLFVINLVIVLLEEISLRLLSIYYKFPRGLKLRYVIKSE